MGLGTWAAIAGALVLVLAAVAVFVWLPAVVERGEEARQAAAVPEPVAAEPEPSGPVLSPEETAALKAQAETLLAGLLTQQSALRALNLANWAADDEQRYRDLSEAGDNAFLADDFTAAVSNYTEAQTLGEALAKRAVSTVDQSLEAAKAAVAVGDVESALAEYGRVLAVDPQHPGALAGRTRAERLPEVLSLVRRADGELDRGELATALASYQAALAIDGDWEAARAGVAAANRALRAAEFDRRMSAGFGHLSAEDYAAASDEFQAALALRPSAPEALDGLAQAEQGMKLDEIALIEARAVAFERRELWSQAVALYRSALESDATLVFAQEGLQRAGARAGLEAKLVNLIDNPTLLFADNILADANALLEEAAVQSPRGPRLEEQIGQLGRLVALASTPIPVELTSDQLTEVTLYRVGALGAFAAKQVELRPGTYTVIGSRNGYRDVRQTFTVRPGRNLAPISVVCVEPI
jgi:hypothetical protein